MQIKIKNKLVTLSYWHCYYNGVYYDYSDMPTNLAYKDDLLVIRSVTNIHDLVFKPFGDYIGFRKHLSWEDYVVDAEFEGLFDEISTLYNLIYDYPTYCYADLEKAKNHLDNFLLKFDKLKSFI